MTLVEGFFRWVALVGVILLAVVVLLFVGLGKLFWMPLKVVRAVRNAFV